jgi:hypothetical protein
MSDTGHAAVRVGFGVGFVAGLDSAIDAIEAMLPRVRGEVAAEAALRRLKADLEQQRREAVDRMGADDE